MRIAICEDNQNHVEILKNMILRWAEKENVKADIGCYKSAEEFMFRWDEDGQYDLAFLDIQMANMNGMQLAQYIRQQDRTMLLIFTTSFLEYAVKGYEVDAFRYIQKPLRETKVAAVLTKARHEIEEARKDAVIVPTADGLVRVFKNDIYYVEVDNHYIIMHIPARRLS